MSRGERRERTDRIVKRRVKVAKRKGYLEPKPGKFKKHRPVCYCTMCRLARIPSAPLRPPIAEEGYESRG